ncbi:MAG TPA: decaprenyl-phosphate phosphoribosyltransferase [Aggregatilineales bacterium]|nr:decaprenyl-phosphate phosphoribosyltransferase [Aggregatilineales bacterium]
MFPVAIGLLKTMRPKQWTKNVFVYAGLVFDGQLLQTDSFLRVTAVFLLLCLSASTVYIINDLVDIERDRQHPTKKNRPLPSGRLPIPVAIASAIIIPIVTLLLSTLLTPLLTLVLMSYIVLNILYSFYLKHIVLIDVMSIAASYVLRVAAGVLVIQVARFSPWLYADMALLALFLAIGKRRQEQVSLGEKALLTRPIFRYYNLTLLDEMLRVVTTSTLIAYILYTIEAPSPLLGRYNMALLTVPFVMYAIFRYMYLIYVRGDGSAPDEVILRDRPLQAAFVLWAASFVVILYIVPQLLVPA